MAVFGAIIGAGFASGKEIVSFFGNLGFWAIPVILLVGSLFFCCFYLFSKIGKMVRPNSISDITRAIFGNAYIFVDFSFVLCSFITLSSMLAGCDSIGQIAFGQSYNFCYISILTAIIVAIIISTGLKYIYKINNIVLPTILIFIVVIIFSFFVSGGADSSVELTINTNIFSGIVSAVLYVSMNIFTNIFIIAKSSSYLNKKQLALCCGVASGLLVVFIISILCCILFGGTMVFGSDMPMITLAFGLNNFFGIVYSIVLWLAIFTTICVASYSILTWLNNYIKNKFWCAVIILTLGFVFSRFGFSNIVNIFYPLEGVFAFIMIIFSARYYFKNRKTFMLNQEYLYLDVQNQKFGTSDNYFDKKHFEKLKQISTINQHQSVDKNNLKNNDIGTQATNMQCNNNNSIAQNDNNQMYFNNQLPKHVKANNAISPEQIDSVKIEKKNGAVVITKKIHKKSKKNDNKR